MPICPAVLTQPNMISGNSEYLLKRASGSLEDDVGLLNVSYFAANLSLKSCKPQRHPFSHICTAEITNFDVKWVCRAGHFFVLSLLFFLQNESQPPAHVNILSFTFISDVSFPILSISRKKDAIQVHTRVLAFSGHSAEIIECIQKYLNMALRDEMKCAIRRRMFASSRMFQFG